MSGWSFDPRPSNGGHHPVSKDCTLLPPSHLEAALLNYIICLCLAVKAARPHLLLCSIANHAANAPTLSAVEYSLRDEEVAE